MIFANGNAIYKAAIAGAKRGYNRSTDDYSKYEALISNCYNNMLLTVEDEEERLQIIENTDGMWQNTVLPVFLVMLHKHKGGKECEVHARVYLQTMEGSVFDIPLLHWQRLSSKSTKYFNQLAA